MARKKEQSEEKEEKEKGPQQTIKFSKEADAAFDSFLARFGKLPKSVTISNLMLWFATAPEVVQDVVLGRIAEQLRPAAYKCICDYFAARLGIQTDPAKGVIVATAPIAQQESKPASRVVNPKDPAPVKAPAKA